jgi:hypothetical protein
MIFEIKVACILLGVVSVDFDFGILKLFEIQILSAYLFLKDSVDLQAFTLGYFGIY